MGPNLVAGVLIAWAMTQLLGGGFFVLAHARAKREAEYLLFGLLCFALSLMTAALVFGTLTDSDADWLRATQLGHGAGVLAVCLNLHFALRYSGWSYPAWLVRAIYAVAAVFELANLTGFWWRPDTVIQWTTHVMGGSFVLRSAEPTAIASVFYVVTAAELAASVGLVFFAYSSGKREALFACFGGVVLCLAGVHDILLAVAVVQDSQIGRAHV